MSKYLYFILVILVINGCFSPQRRNHVECLDYDISEFVGVYKNQGSEYLGGRALHLTEVLWINSHGISKTTHESIDRVALSFNENNQMHMSAYSGSKLVSSGVIDKEIEIQGNIIKVFSKTSVLPDPSGGLMVGPQSVQIDLKLTCEKNIEFHKHESAIGLVLLIIPMGGSNDFHSEFSRIN